MKREKERFNKGMKRMWLVFCEIWSASEVEKRWNKEGE
jgi:hypothetical protein